MRHGVPFQISSMLALDRDVQLHSVLSAHPQSLLVPTYPHVLLTYLFKKYVIYLSCVNVYCVCDGVEARGQRWGVGSLFTM